MYLSTKVPSAVIPPAMTQRQAGPLKTISDTSKRHTASRHTAQRHPPLTRIVCFAGAGAAASFFRAWRDIDSQNTHVAAFQPKGREGRRGSAFSSLGESVHDAVAAIVAQQTETPADRFALFGHSYGALLAYEVAQALSHVPIKLSHLFVAARAAPQMAPLHQLAADMTDANLARALRDLGVKDDMVLNHPALGPMILNILRHDLRQNASYTHYHDTPLTCPITALSGVKDPLASPLVMANWQSCTTGPFFHYRFQGGHFFPVEIHKRLAHLIKSRISSPFMETLS